MTNTPEMLVPISSVSVGVVARAIGPSVVARPMLILSLLSPPFVDPRDPIHLSLQPKSVSSLSVMPHAWSLPRAAHLG